MKERLPFLHRSGSHERGVARLVKLGMHVALGRLFEPEKGDGATHLVQVDLARLESVAARLGFCLQLGLKCEHLGATEHCRLITQVNDGGCHPRHQVSGLR